jgi:hypothetical protein
MPADVADMIDTPWSAPVITPAALIDATLGFELFQVTSVAADVAPEAVVTFAVACTEVPDSIRVGTVIASLGDVSGAVDPDPPHAAATRTKLQRSNEWECIWHSPLTGDEPRAFMASGDRWEVGRRRPADRIALVR